MRSDINVLYLHSRFQELFRLPGSVAHSLLSETVASRRCSSRDDLNFHFSGSSLSSSARDNTESTEELVAVRLIRGQRHLLGWPQVLLLDCLTKKEKRKKKEGGGIFREDLTFV